MNAGYQSAIAHGLIQIVHGDGKWSLGNCGIGTINDTFQWWQRCTYGENNNVWKIAIENDWKNVCGCLPKAIAKIAQKTAAERYIAIDFAVSSRYDS